jgi:hypothetical protein
VLDHSGYFQPGSLGGRDLILLPLAFSPDGKTLASAGGGQLKGPGGGAAQAGRLATIGRRDRQNR